MVFLPNITTSTPLSSFFNEGITKILYRVFIAISFGVISFGAFFANQIEINKLLMYLLFGFLAFLIFGSFFNMSPISISHINNYYEKVTIISKTGIIDVLTYYGNLAFSYIFCFAAFTCIPIVMKDKNKFLWLLDIFIAVMLILCLISYVKDFELYIAVFKLDYNQYGAKDISSLFPSKNAFGVFLFQGVASALIAHHYRQNSKFRFLYLISSSIMGLTLLCSLCKDAIFALGLFIIVSFIYFLLKKQKTKKDYICIIIWSFIVFVVFVVAILVLNQSAFSNVPLLKKIYLFLGSNPVNKNDNALIGRLEIVAVFFLGISGFHYLIGYGQALPANTYIWTLTYRGEGNDNLHNTFLNMFGTGGILYLAFYLLILFYLFSLIFKTRKGDQKLFFLLFGLLSAHTFYSLFETSVLFLSGSSATMLLAIIFVTLLYKQAHNNILKGRESFYEVTI